jgi:hypothetical protein
MAWERGVAMAKRAIPENLGHFRVQTAKAGNYIVINDRTGKNKVVIPCKDHQQAVQLCERLNAGDHNGEVMVPNHP